jgi:putative endonuclease
MRRTRADGYGGYVYILASRRHGTLYTGVTSDLVTRVWQHREGVVLGFTKTYRVHRLVYFEAFGSIVDTIEREKRMKKWRRDWKIRLIAEANPHWVDLYDNLAR